MWYSTILLAAAVGVYYFPHRPWIGIIFGTTGLIVSYGIVFGDVIFEERGFAAPGFPVLFLIYYGITLVFFPPYREALLASALIGCGYLFFVSGKRLELVSSGFSLFGITKPLSKPVSIYNPLAVVFKRMKAFNMFYVLVSIICAVYLLEMIAS